MKLKKQKISRYTYQFEVVEADVFPISVNIKRNNDPYCRFYKGTFINYDNYEMKLMSTSEKVKIWKHINHYTTDVGSHDLVVCF